MTDQHALNAEVTKQYDRVIVWSDRMIMHALPLVTMLFQEIIESFAHCLIRSLNIAVSHNIGLKPIVYVIISYVLFQVLR